MLFTLVIIIVYNPNINKHLTVGVKMSYGFNNYSSLGLTLGLAALGLAAYSLRHQEARAFAWIRNRLGTTRTIDSVGRGTLDTIPASTERLTLLLDPTHARLWSNSLVVAPFPTNRHSMEL